MLKEILLWSLVYTVLTLIGAVFVQADLAMLNPFNWETQGRFTFVFMMVIGVWPLSALLYIDKQEEE